MTTVDAAVMRVQSLRRYPVKSMLGESVERLFVDESGADGDRRSAVIDTVTGRIASAKQPRFWRALLKCSATWDAGRVVIRLPDATTAAVDDDGIDDVLSRLLGRAVFWATYPLVLIFQLLSNGILTGRNIVMYDPSAILGWRIAHAPVEDLLFGFAMVLLTLDLWIWWGRRGVN